jgi:hypothetical protein
VFVGVDDMIDSALIMARSLAELLVLDVRLASLGDNRETHEGDSDNSGGGGIS